jgi:hypothetical protein
MRRATGAEGVSVNGRCISQGSTRRSSLLANPSRLDGINVAHADTLELRYVE